MFTLALGNTTTGFEGEFRFLADAQGLGTPVGRHPSANLLPIFNDTYKSLREQVTEWGYTQFLTRGTTTAMPTTAFETGETYATITISQSLQQIKAIDAKLTNGRWKRLDEVSFLQLRDTYIEPNAPGTPDVWCWLDAGSVSGANYTAGRIAIAPVPNGGSYVLWSMNAFTDLASTTDVFLYHNSDWKQWHMLTALVRVCGVRDKDTAKKLETAMYELNPRNEGTVAERMKSQAPTASGPKTWTRSENYRGSRGPWG